jgi:hypothetical protein
LVVLPDLFNVLNRTVTIAFAAKHRVPAIQYAANPTLSGMRASLAELISGRCDVAHIFTHASLLYRAMSGESRRVPGVARPRSPADLRIDSDDSARHPQAIAAHKVE